MGKGTGKRKPYVPAGPHPTQRLPLLLPRRSRRQYSPKHARRQGVPGRFERATWDPESPVLCEHRTPSRAKGMQAMAWTDQGRGLPGSAAGEAGAQHAAAERSSLVAAHIPDRIERIAPTHDPDLSPAHIDNANALVDEIADGPNVGAHAAIVACDGRSASAQPYNSIAFRKKTLWCQSGGSRPDMCLTSSASQCG
jgi:hypothetical protein